MHHGKYGTWKPFNADEIHSGVAYAAPRALLILEAQSHLLGFLPTFCVNILEGKPPTPICDIDSTTNYSKWIAHLNGEPLQNKSTPWVSVSSYSASLPSLPHQSSVSTHSSKSQRVKLWRRRTNFGCSKLIPGIFTNAQNIMKHGGEISLLSVLSVTRRDMA